MCWKLRVSPGTRPKLQGSDNPWSADNQQERLESVLDVAMIPEAIGYHLAGFAGWRRKLQRVVPTADRLRVSVESVAVLQRFATRACNSGGPPEAPGMWDDAAAS